MWDRATILTTWLDQPLPTLAAPSAPPPVTTPAAPRRSPLTKADPETAWRRFADLSPDPRGLPG